MAPLRIQTQPPALERAAFAEGIAALRVELALPAAFPPAALAEAAAIDPAGGVVDPGPLVGAATRRDRTALPLVTRDPLGSRDLDQAFAIEPDGDGHRLFYAIADVAAHVLPGGAIDREARLRGETLYLPDGRIPLHPLALSEGGASLLPGADRLAVLWTLAIDAGGAITQTAVERAIVRSTAQLDYAGASADLARGSAHPQLVRLAELGPRLAAAQLAAGAIELPEPEQELIESGGAPGDWALAWVPRSPLQDWNAELSLATGRAAAALMLHGRCGLLRTLPPAPADALPRLRAAATALGVDWLAEESLQHRLARLDWADPTHLALIDAARALLRGAGYLAVDGALPTPDAAIHAAVATPYAHVTAPLRRLGDRFATECALAACAGVPVPAWARTALPDLPELLTAGGRRGGAVGRAVLDLAEALVLEPRVGERFEVAVIEANGTSAEVHLIDPPVRARCDGSGLVAGAVASVQLTVADPTTRRLRFAVPAD